MNCMNMYNEKFCNEYVGHFIFYTTHPKYLDSFKRRLSNNNLNIPSIYPKVSENKKIEKDLYDLFNDTEKTNRKENFISNKHLDNIILC